MNAADEWFDKGMVLVEAERWEEALECFERALKLKPNDADILCNKGAVLSELERDQEASNCFQQALKINPNHVQACHNEGRMYALYSNHEGAIQWFDRAIKIDPNYSKAWYDKGVSLLKGLKLYQDALECLEKAKSLGHPNAEQAIKMCRMLITLGDKGD